ncbi:TM221 protein, partial [Daphoenositta chrysoptera]|nr:TM221 protein [Daphoenositta chrysoptera]
RAGWFLLGSRSVRHAAIGLFCCGLCLYLTGKSLALSMLLLFEPAAAIASASVLASGILLLLLTALHALLRNSQISPPGPSGHSLYENDSAPHGDGAGGDLNTEPAAPARPRPEIHREFSFPPFPGRKSQ